MFGNWVFTKQFVLVLIRNKFQRTNNYRMSWFDVLGETESCFFVIVHLFLRFVSKLCMFPNSIFLIPNKFSYRMCNVHFNCNEKINKLTLFTFLIKNM